MKQRYNRAWLEMLKSRVRLEELIAETEPLTGQGRYRRGQQHDSLVVDVERQIYYWNSRSGSRPGDLFDWLMLASDCSFPEAVAQVADRLGLELEDDHPRPSPSPPTPRTSRRLAPPPAAWQARARTIVTRAQESLWSPAGRVGRATLHRRGLADETIRRAGLGWTPHDQWEAPAQWGLTGGRQIWLPRGLVIPWLIEGALWRIRIRRLEGEPAYYSPRLYPTERTDYPFDHEALYNIEALTAGRPAILLEGEFDCLAVAQAAGDLAVPVATGSVSGARRLRWLSRLVRCAPLLIAFDADPAGDRAARYWLAQLPHARRWRPFWADANQMAQDGIDLRGWLAAGLG